MLRLLKNPTRWLHLSLAFALLIRLVYVFSLDPLVQFNSGGDSGFYLQLGRDWVGGVDYTNIPIPVAPLYLLVVGIPQQFLSPASSVFVIFILNCILLTFSCYLTYRITALLSDTRAGVIAAGALATSIAFIVEAGKIHTETIYIFFLLLAIWLYLNGFVDVEIPQTRHYVVLCLAGAIFGLATLTRPVSLFFPIGIAIHLLMLRRWKAIVPFLLTVALVTLSWTAFTALNYNWTAIGSNQFMPAVWRGVVANDGSPTQNDELLGDDTPTEQVTEIILQEPLIVIQRRIVELVTAYLEPHNTFVFGSASLRQLTLDWFNSGFEWSRFVTLIQSEGFLPKLVIYIWHYVALIGGFVGMWLSRDKWRYSLVLIGFIAYTTMLHLVVLAIPRYIFPTYPFFWIFASITIITIWDTVANQKQAEDNPLPVMNS